MDLDGLENDPVWEKSKKAASEFGIPIVVIDGEKVISIVPGGEIKKRIKDDSKIEVE